MNVLSSSGSRLPLLGVEQEDQPQDHGEQRAIDLVRGLPEWIAEYIRAAARCVRRLDAAQQVVEAVQHLVCEAFR